MVDCYGKWIAEEDYKVFPKEKWCDCDYVAAWIKDMGYKPKTNIENLVEMIITAYDLYLTDNEVEFYSDINKPENGSMISIVDIDCFIKEQGGLKEFDFYC